MSEKKSICFTGKLSKPRKEMQALAASHGFEVKTSVVYGLSYLVCPDDEWTSTKVRAAMRKGVTRVLESEFWRLVELDELESLMH